ncbi:MAG TPA: FAD-binding oxidoreductase [Thermoleophilia bacterium]|nr:FAD-binding oxidoreductase [Thermoleophilia bacterium]
MSSRMLSDEVVAHLQGLVGSRNIRESPDHHVAGVRPCAEVLVGDVDELADVMRVAAESDLTVCPTGGGTKLGWGAPPRACDLLVRTTAWRAEGSVGSGEARHAEGHLLPPLGSMGAITEYDPDNLTVTAGAGTTLAALQDLAARDGLLLPLDPPMPESATLGGVLSTNDHGPHRMLHGSMRDVVLGLGAVLVGGDRVKAGGRTIKNVTGYDLTRLFIGAFGSLGVMSEATIRLLPGPSREHVVVGSMPDLAAADAAVRGLLGSQLIPAAVEVLSPASSRMVDADVVGIMGAGGHVVLVAFEGDAVAVERQVRDVVRVLGEEGTTLILTAPGPVSSVWSALAAQRRAARSAGYSVEAKLSVPRSELLGLLGLAESLPAAAQGDLMWTASAGSGTARLWLGSPGTVGAAPPGCCDLLLRVRAAAERVGGSLVLVEGADILCGELDVWGADPGGVDLMRTLKGKFDPRGLMNPGRCAGGI